MFVRLAVEKDREPLRELAKAHVAEITPHLEWSDERADATFTKCITECNPTMFVAEHRGEIIGYVGAVVADYGYTSGFCVKLDVIYVRPDKRGSRAAALLLTQFNKWADSLGPDEIICCMSNPDVSERTLRFVQRFGFKPEGLALQRMVRG